jgi:hypothetical protein
LATTTNLIKETDMANTTKRRKRTKKSFLKAWKRLPAEEQRQIKTDFCARFDKAISSFNYKKNGESIIYEDEERFLVKRFNDLGLDAWTGTKI